jgi:hypothetical protein
MSSSKDLLEEIKVVYTTVKEFEQQTAAAANTLIAVSGTIATLLFVFGSYLLSNIVPDYYLRNYMFYTLAFGIIAGLFSLLWSIRISHSVKRPFLWPSGCMSIRRLVSD